MIHIYPNTSLWLINTPNTISTSSCKIWPDFILFIIDFDYMVKAFNTSHWSENFRVFEHTNTSSCYTLREFACFLTFHITGRGTVTILRTRREIWSVDHRLFLGSLIIALATTKTGTSCLFTIFSRFTLNFPHCLCFSS